MSGSGETAAVFWRKLSASGPGPGGEARGPLLSTDALFAACNESVLGLTAVKSGGAEDDANDKLMYLLSSDEDDEGEEEEEEEEDEDDHDVKGAAAAVFRCPFPGCVSRWTSVSDVDEHLACCHSHSCSACHKCFPSSHLLDLHVSENHDVFFEAEAERGPAFRCLVRHCGLAFPSAGLRLKHAEDAHAYAPHFRFDPSPGRSRSSPSNKNKNKEKEEEAADCAGKSSVPPGPRGAGVGVRGGVPFKICFGHRKTPAFRHTPEFGFRSGRGGGGNGGGGGGKSNKNKKETDIDMKDMSDALVEAATVSDGFGGGSTEEARQPESVALFL